MPPTPKRDEEYRAWVAGLRAGDTVMAMDYCGEMKPHTLKMDTPCYWVVCGRYYSKLTGKRLRGTERLGMPAPAELELT